MEQAMTSPFSGLYEDEMGQTVMESTAADMGLVATRHYGSPLPEISIISPGKAHKTMQSTVEIEVGRKDNAVEDRSKEKVSVHLRIRPLLEGEKERGEEQGCVCIQDKQTVVFKAPKDSFNMKSSERGISQSVHKFTFTQVWGPETTQQQLFDCLMKEAVWDVLHGKNRLLYTYGVTNSGKTYTIQGKGQDAGLLPRTLVALFSRLRGRLYDALDLKPVLCQEVRRLNRSEARAEEIRREALLTEAHHDIMEETVASCSSKSWSNTNVSCDSGFGGLSTMGHLHDSGSPCLDADSASLSTVEGLTEGVQYSVWVSFFEIYNEFLYDLLEAPASLQPRRRVTLRLCDDRHGNPYVKDLTWVQVHSAEEAWKILQVGRRNQSFASTHLNQSSSRSHSIFTIRVLHVRPGDNKAQSTGISELCVCDLAGSERCKDQRSGDRMKEANNINTSLLTLGRCITALRYNQVNRSRPAALVPFRDSKLTRVLQGYFCGQGRSCMVVNVNPSASTYDETLQALKFSAVATQLVHMPATKTRVAYILSLLQEPPAQCDESTVQDEDDDGEEEQGDLTMFDCEALLRAIDVLKGEVRRQRQEKELLEAQVREQVYAEMMEHITSMERGFSETLETERALLEDRHDSKLENLRSGLKKYYMQEIEDRDEQIKELTAELDRWSDKDRGMSQQSTEAAMAPEGLRRSNRLVSSKTKELVGAQEQGKKQEIKYKVQLDMPTPTRNLTITVDHKLEDGHKNLRRLRMDLQQLGQHLQCAEKACCHNTGGQRLRSLLVAAEHMLSKQDHTLLEMQRSWFLIKADLERMDWSQARLPRASPATPAPSLCRKRAHGAARSDSENHCPEKKTFLCSPVPDHTPVRGLAGSSVPRSRVLRSHQINSPSSPSFLTSRLKH